VKKFGDRTKRSCRKMRSVQASSRVICKDCWRRAKPASPRIVRAGRTGQRADFAATVPLFVGLDRLPLGLASRREVEFWRFFALSWSVIRAQDVAK
jgi:hypothetical protein